MATGDVQKTIDLIFNGVDNASSTMNVIDRNVSSFSRGLESAASPLAGLADKIIQVDLLVGGLTAAMLGFSLNAAVKFEAAMLDLQKVLSDNEQLTDEHKEQIRELSDTYGVAGPAVVQSLAGFKQAGFDLQESFLLADTALKAVVITELSADQATEKLKQTLRGFNLEADQSARVLDVVNELSNRYGVNAGQLFEALADISPVARAAGLSLEQMAGIMVPVIEVFGSGSESARAFKTGLNKLLDDSQPVIQTLTDIGVFTDGTSDAFANSGEILAELARVYPTLTEKQQQFVAAQVFGIDQSGKLGEALSKYDRGLAATRDALDAAGSAQKEFEVRSQAVEFQIARVTASFGRLQTAIGKQFLAQFGGLTEASNELLKTWEKIVNDGGLAPLFDLLNPLIADFENQIRQVAENLPAAFAGVDFSELVAAFEDLGAEVSGLFEGVDLTTVEGLQSALQLIINLGARLVESTAGIVESFGPFISTIGDVIQAVSEMDAETAKSIGNLAGIGKQVELISPVVRDLTGAVNALSTVLAVSFGANALASVRSFGGGIAAAGTAFGGLTAAQKAFGAAAWFEVVRRGVPHLIDMAHNLGLIDSNMQDIASRGGDVFEWIFTYGDGLDAQIDQTEREWFAHFQELHQRSREAGDQVNDNLAAGLEPGALQQLADDSIAAIERIAAANIDWSQGVEVVRDAIRDVHDQPIVNDAELDKLVVGGQDFVRTWQDGVPTFDAVGDAAVGAAAKTTKALDEAQEKTEQYHLALLEIASDERIEFKKLEVELDIAQLEAQARAVSDIIDSVDAGIESTGNLLGDLFDSFTGADLFEKSVIKDQIDAENRRRDQEFKLQERIANAQIEAMTLNAQRYAEGIEIRVDASAIEPHLQAVLESMLVNARIEMNEAGVEALLACPG